MKKKILIIVLTVTALVLFVRPINEGGNRIPQKYIQTCLGFKLILPNSFDTGALGFCFGIVKKQLNPRYNSFLESFKYKTVLEIDQTILPEGIYIKKNESDISILYNETNDPLYVVYPLKDSSEYFISEIPLGYVASYKLTKDDLYFKADYKYFLTKEKAYFHEVPPEWRSYKRNSININYEIQDMMIPTKDPNIFTMTLYYKNNLISVPVKHIKQLNENYEDIIKRFK
jgi:hypothetical protein